MAELINGKIYGTLEIPVDELSMQTIVKYFDFGDMTVHEIADAIGTTYGTTCYMLRKANKGGVDRRITAGEREKLAQRLKMLLRMRKTSMSEVARNIGVTAAAVSHWAAKMNFPRDPQLEALAEYFDVSTDYLRGRTNVLKPYKRPINTQNWRVKNG